MNVFICYTIGRMILITDMSERLMLLEFDGTALIS